MSFITDYQIPIYCFQLKLYIFIAGELIQPGDAKGYFHKWVASTGCLDTVIGKNIKIYIKTAR